MSAIEVQGLRYCYPGSERPALILDELVLQEGEIYWLTGVNGAGKTTLCRLLAGLIPHFFRGDLSGRVTMYGKDLTALKLAEVSGLVGFIMDDPFDQLTRATYSVRDEISFGLQNIGLPPEEIRSRVDESMEALEITSLADRLPTSLSGGEQQLVAIASIFARRPSVFVMDEATSQLDPQACSAIFDLVSRFKDSGKTILMVEPKPDRISQTADRVVILDQGHMIAQEEIRNVINSGVYENAKLSLPSYPALARALSSYNIKTESIPITLKEACEMVERLRHERY